MSFGINVLVLYFKLSKESIMWIQISDKSIKGLLKWITTEGMILFKESTTFTIEDIKIKRPVLKYHMSDHIIDNKNLGFILLNKILMLNFNKVHKSIFISYLQLMVNNLDLLIMFG